MKTRMSLRRPGRFLAWTPGHLLGGLALLMLSMAAQSDTVSCDVLLEESNYEKSLVNGGGREVQRGLNVVFGEAYESSDPKDCSHESCLFDGYIGKRTRPWMVRFCERFPIHVIPGRDARARKALVKDVVDATIQFARLAEVHSNWREVLASQEFESWINERPQGEAINIKQLRRSGAASVVIRLIDDFNSRVPREPRQARQPDSPRGDSQCPPAPGPGSGLYFQLDAPAVDALALRKEIPDKLRSLIGQTIASSTALDQKLSDLELPLVAPCQRVEILAAIRNDADSRARVTLSGESLQTLALESLPRNVLEELRNLEDVSYLSKAELEREVRWTIRRVLDSQPVLSIALEPSSSSKSSSPPGATTEVPSAPSPPVEAAAATDADGSRQGPGEGGHGESGDYVGLTEQVTAYTELVVAQAVPREWAVTPEGVRNALALSHLVEIPGDVLEGLAPLLDVAFVNERLFQAALHGVLDADLSDPVREAITAQARRTWTVPAVPRPIPVSGGCSGCVRDFQAPAYGFLPVWKAIVGKDPDEFGASLPIDFSMFDRIGYFALDINPQGVISEPAYWRNNTGAAELVVNAHRHRTSVDLGVYMTGWTQWTRQQIEVAVSAIAGRVTTAVPQDKRLIQRYVDGDAFLDRRLDGVTLYFHGYPETDSGQRGTLMSIVRALHSALAGSGDGWQFAINVMMDVRLGEGREDGSEERSTEDEQHYLLRDIGEVLLEVDGQPALVDNALLFLEAPTSQSKKRLRQRVESEFRGLSRAQVLRKIRPVISPNGYVNRPVPDDQSQDEAAVEARNGVLQLEDDLIYFKDNFRGVGFWPLPLDDGPETGMLKARMQQFLKKDEPADALEAFLEREWPGICAFACPNRWYFRIAFDIVLPIWAVLFYMRWSACPPGRAPARKGSTLRLLLGKLRPWLLWLLALVTIGVVVVMFGCDPWIQARRTQWLIYFFLVVLLAGFALRVRVLLKSSRKDP